MRLAYPHTVFHIGDKLSHLESLIYRAQQLKLDRQWRLRLAAGRRGHVHGLYVRVALQADERVPVVQADRASRGAPWTILLLPTRFCWAWLSRHEATLRLMLRRLPLLSHPFARDSFKLARSRCHWQHGESLTPKRRAGEQQHSRRKDSTHSTPPHTHTNPTPPKIRLPFVVPRPSW